MKRFIFSAALALLCGCPRPLPPPISSVPGMPTCGMTSPTADDVCLGLFTPSGLACVQCPGVSGCYDAELAVYCVAGGCADTACEVH